MEEKNNKNSRAFYLTIAVVIAVVTVLIIAIVAARQSVPAPDGPNLDTGSGDLSNDTPTLDENEDTLPTFSLPIEGELSVDFSDSVPVFSQTMNDYRTHLGVDIKAELGKEVLAVADGTVSNVWVDPFMGTCVSIDHSGEAVSIYKNLAPEVNEGIIIGASVKSGDVIGAVGETAMNEIAQEPHLHYELKVDGKHIDPKTHLNFSAPQNPSEDTSSSENQ
jgi:murein DD-endopeptidase MepM/ murein hydrolase activator NlpD